ncbi:MAG: amidohydrolase family protein, partial [Opitutaceae bacterium]
MSIIDAHVHLYPAELNRDPVAWAASRAETHWAMLCTRLRKSGQAIQSFPSVKELLESMDAAAVERAILLGWYWQWPETCVWHNHFMSICVKEHPDRFSAFATMHPSAGRDAVVDIVRTARERGFSGLGELSPHSQGYDVGDPVFQEVLELAGELRLPVNFHVTDLEGAFYPGRVKTPLRDFLWLAKTYPQANFILAHWGGLLPLHDEEAEELFNVFYDTAASPLIYDESIWRRFLEVVPVERIVFGSDFPLNLYPKL